MPKRKLRIPKRQEAAQQWLPLYQMADRIKELAPWDWMEESDVFGVQDPESGEIGFVSVMGTLGEHVCIGVYLGVDALYQFFDLEELADSTDSWEIASRLLTIPQLQASFENQDLIEKEDAGIMRKLNLKYSGPNAYPLFRSFQPGCPPYFLEPHHISFLTHILEQTLDVAPRFREDESLLYSGDDEMFLVRVPLQQDDEIRWIDEFRAFPPPEIHSIPVEIDKKSLAKLQNAPRVGNIVEIDLFMMSIPIEGRRNERPFFPFSLLIADADSGMILSQEMLSPLPSLDHMFGQVPQTVVNFLLNANILPHEIHTQSPMITAVLSTAFAELDMPVVEQPFLPMIDEARTALLHMLEMGFDEGFDKD